MDIAICIVTYRRPSGLMNLMNGIKRLDINESIINSVKVVVIDNDPDGSSYDVIRKIRENFPMPIFYKIEKRRGIPIARNSAVKYAGDVEFVAFIDDDEVPEKEWLNRLVETQITYKADGVEGKVDCYFKHNAPKWIKKGKFFDKKSKNTGERVVLAATNNLLIKKEILERFPFNENLALTGGSDTYLFTELSYEGYQFVFCKEAVVKEIIPQSRTNLKWILIRAFRVGITRAICTDVEGNILYAKFRRTFIGILKIIQGIVLFLPSLLLGRHKVVLALRFIFMGLGNIIGLLGIKYHEYRKVHGQ